MRDKKWLKRIGIALLSIVGVLILALAIVLNFIVTPELLTPKVLQYADEYLDADVKMERVEATFFSSFPRFGVKVTNGQVVSRAFHRLPSDTVVSRRDTVARFGELRAGLNLMQLITSGDIVIGNVTISDANIRLITDSLGRSNWDIVKADTTAAAQAVSASDTTSTNIWLRRLVVNNSSLTYADRTGLVFFKADSINLDAEGDINLDSLSFDIDAEVLRTSCSYGGTRYIRRLPLAVKGHLDYNLTRQQGSLQDTRIVVDGHDINIDGGFTSAANATDVNIDFGVDSPSAKKLFALIPSDVVPQEIDIDQGTVSATGWVRGRYSDSEIPVIGCNVTIDHIKGKYEGMKYGIEDLTAKFDALLDFQQKDLSHVNLEIFHFKGGNNEVESVIKVSRALSVGDVDCLFKAHINLPSVTQMFPLGYTRMYGDVAADLSAQFRLADLRRGDVARVKITGTFDIDSLYIRNDSIGLIVRNDAHMRFRSGKDRKGRDMGDSIGVNVKISHLELTHPLLEAKITDFKGRGRTSMHPDTSVISGFRGFVSANRIFVNSDTVLVLAKNLESRINIKPSDNNPKKPNQTFSLKSDTIFASIFGFRSFTQGLDAHAMYEKDTDSTWVSDMGLGFNLLRVKMPYYKQNIIASDTYISQGDRTINIEKSHLQVGQTSMDVSAVVHNLYYSIAKNKPLEATLKVDADVVNLNELMSSYIDTDAGKEIAKSQIDMSVDTVNTIRVAANKGLFDSTDEAEGDTIPSSIYRIPNRIRFSLDTKANTVIYDKLQLDEVKGRVEVIDGCLHVTNVNFKQNGSKAISILGYKPHPKGDDRADVIAFVRWERADIGGLINTLGVDTIMPMLKPFQGKVDCYMTARVELDSTLNFNPDNAAVSMHVGAKKLTLLDGETFAKLSKILMFKNKKENVIDTVSFNVIADHGKLEVLPFRMQMDRYEAIIGGDQTLSDMKLNYHVSIVKSPLPFKAGVDILGNPDDINYDVTKAKLKKHATKEEQEKNDALTLQLRLEAIRAIYGMSGLPMPEQLRSEQDKQLEKIRQQIKAAETATVNSILADVKAAKEEAAQLSDSASQSKQ